MTKPEISDLKHRADILFCCLTNALTASRDAGDSEETISSLTTAKRLAFETTVACGRLQAGIDREEVNNNGA